MLTRILMGLAMATGIVSILLFTPPTGLLAVVVFALLMGAREFQAIAHPEADAVDKVAFTAAVTLTALHPAIAPYVPSYDQSKALLASFAVLAMVRLFRPDPLDAAIRRLSADALGLLYIGLTVPLIYLLRLRTHGGYEVLMVMAITFGADSGAFFAGKFLGRHKLYEKLSPKKTIEGAVGGMAVGIGAAFLARAILPGLGDLTVQDAILLGGVGAFVGMLGDLFESLLKRSCGVKDSGTLIPGHGGVLDRIDALLFVGPFAWYYLEHFAR